MGAEVIVLEKPGGSDTRALGPFCGNCLDKEKSLYWFAYNTNKKGITLDIRRRGQGYFETPGQGADFLLESFPPGTMERMRLGYGALSQINPGLIMVSMTPYGQEGPYADFAASDITTWAMGGMLCNTGFPGHVPLWFGYPQSNLNTGAEGAAAAMIALWQRNATGLGQYVDVAEQQSVVWFTYIVTMIWDLNRRVNTRQGNDLATGTIPLRIVFPCRDGYVCLLPMGGGNAIFVSSSESLVRWMDEERMAPTWLLEVDWARDYEATSLEEGLVRKVNEVIERFCLTKTKEELYTGGFRKKY